MNRKIKLYLSLPITGRNLEDVKKYAEKVKASWVNSGYDVVTPFEICKEENTYAYYMGKDIETLLGCDGIIMCHDWFSSKGCRLENFAANVYKLMVKIDNTPYKGRYEKG